MHDINMWKKVNKKAVKNKKSRNRALDRDKEVEYRIHKEVQI